MYQCQNWRTLLHALILQVVLLGRNIVRQTDKLNSYGTARSEALNSHSQDKYCKHVSMIFKIIYRQQNLKICLLNRPRFWNLHGKIDYWWRPKKRTKIQKCPLYPWSHLYRTCTSILWSNTGTSQPWWEVFISRKNIIFQKILVILGKRSRSDDGLGIFNIMRPRYG